MTAAIILVLLIAAIVGIVSLIWHEDEPEHPMRRKTDQ